MTNGCMCRRRSRRRDAVSELVLRLFYGVAVKALIHAGLKQKVKDSEAQNPLNRVKNNF